MTRSRRITLGLIVLAGAFLLTAPAVRRMAGGLPGPGSGAAPAWLTQDVTRGDVSRSISASGTLNPVNQVSVGTQVSGTIKAIHVDYNSAVKAGQLLAELDTVALDADVASSEATVESARASLRLARAQRERNVGLYDKGYITRSELEQSDEKLDTAMATLNQQQAGALRSQHIRRNASIHSPVSGVVVSRDVSVGQTVQASFATPTLFKIAQDLRQMQIEASVAEADIGVVHEGQAAHFTVDAFPSQIRTGVVSQVRNNYALQQNVVTYTVVIRTRNDDLLLRPGMTAYVVLPVMARRDATLIPNAALRYKGPGRTGSTAPLAGDSKTVWRLRDGSVPEPVEVGIGITDGHRTELTVGTLRVGDRLVIGVPANDRGPPGPRLF